MPLAPVFVGLTTLPSRIARMRPAIASLLEQTLVPDRVFVCLPPHSRREQSPYLVPDFLADCAIFGGRVEVVACDRDYGPGTKVAGCAERIPPEGILISADDDMSYRPHLVEGLARPQEAEPGVSFSYHTYDFHGLTVGQGANGFSFHGKNLAGLREFAARVITNPNAFVVDDLWLSFYLDQQGVPIRRVSHEDSAYDPIHDDGQLHGLSGDFKRSRAMRRAGTWLFKNFDCSPAARRAFIRSALIHPPVLIDYLLAPHFRGP